MIQTLEWTERGVRFIDQTKLPTEETYVNCTTYQEVADVIRNMVVRGAPAIGVSAGMGIALGVKDSKAETVSELKREFDEICEVIAKTRPTAVNLFWAIKRMQQKFETLRARPVKQIKQSIIEEAQRMHAEDMAGAMMQKGKIGAVIVGADRIAANGDVANKIGTYTVAVLAKEHGIPFYVAAPVSTIDLDTPDGSLIPIEQRNPAEVTHIAGKAITPAGVEIENHAFDVTPAKLVTAIVTERGIARAPYEQSLAALVRGAEQTTEA